MIIEKEQTSCVRLYNDADFKNLKKAGSLAARTLEYVEKLIRPGVTTDFIDKKNRHQALQIADDALDNCKSHVNQWVDLEYEDKGEWEE